MKYYFGKELVKIIKLENTNIINSFKHLITVKNIFLYKIKRTVEDP